MIAVVDYGAGNLRSIQKGLERQGLDVRITDAPGVLDEADALVVPGDGAFGPAMARLRATGFADRIRAYVASGRPVLGICLGMQLLFEESEEDGVHRGLGILPGRVVRLSGRVKVPHMGWNALTVLRPSPLLAGIETGTYAYFIHSYHAIPADPTLVAAAVDYGGEIAAVVGRGNVWAAQFHPEKSGAGGIRMLANVARWAVGAGASGR
ncbi:MAG TPA: imidazole glycerol phosphate synthase subunit HisH [bacterium]|nr:imidazole glycerol phosphate synthase subunit HisH [bacterium]